MRLFLRVCGLRTSPLISGVVSAIRSFEQGVASDAFAFSRLIFSGRAFGILLEEEPNRQPKFPECPRMDPRNRLDTG